MERLARCGLSLTVAALACAAAAAAVAPAATGEPHSQSITKMFKTNNGLYGVASISGITSRNGRVSSVSGVKFYPQSGSEDMSYYYPTLKSGEKLPNPITFSKEENGRITSGSINIGPGSVSVSSSARSAYPGASMKLGEGFVNPKFPEFPKPMFEDMYFPYPFSSFNSRSYDPWFHDDFAFRPAMQPRFNTLRPGWPYPTFTPFNFW